MMLDKQKLWQKWYLIGLIVICIFIWDVYKFHKLLARPAFGERTPKILKELELEELVALGASPELLDKKRRQLTLEENPNHLEKLELEEFAMHKKLMLAKKTYYQSVEQFTGDPKELKKFQKKEIKKLEKLAAKVQAKRDEVYALARKLYKGKEYKDYLATRIKKLDILEKKYEQEVDKLYTKLNNLKPK